MTGAQESAIRRFYAFDWAQAGERIGSLRRLSSFLTDCFSIETPRGEVLRGPQALTQYAESIETDFASVRMELEQLEVGEDGEIVARGYLSARARTSGFPVRARFEDHWTLRGGQLARARCAIAA